MARDEPVTDTDALTWLREVEKALTPGEWVDGAGDIFAAADLEDGMVRKGECEVASCYGGNRQADEAGILALRNLFPSALAVIERLSAERHELEDGHITPECPDEDNPEPYCFECETAWPCDRRLLFDALDDFTAAVESFGEHTANIERERHG